MDGPQVESVGDPGSGWPHVYHHHLHPSRYQGLCPHPPLLPRPLVSFSGVRASLGLGCTRGEEFGRQGQGPGGGLATLPVADGQLPPDLPVVVTVLALVGKFALAAGFTIFYVDSAELLPTVIR